MRKVICLGFAVGLVCVALSAAADTQQTSSTGYFTGLDQGEVIQQPDGSKVRVGMRSHANLVAESGPLKGQTASQWCDGMALLDGAGAATVNVGYCTLVYDNGDRLWVSYLNKPGQAGQWTVIGGTGRFEGATGSGSGEMVSQRGDGMSWTNQSKGTITTK